MADVDLNSLTNKELKKLLKQHGQATSGNKAALKARLRGFFEWETMADDDNGVQTAGSSAGFGATSTPAASRVPRGIEDRQRMLQQHVQDLQDRENDVLGQLRQEQQRLTQERQGYESELLDLRRQQQQGGSYDRYGASYSAPSGPSGAQRPSAHQHQSTSAPSGHQASAFHQPASGTVNPTSLLSQQGGSATSAMHHINSLASGYMPPPIQPLPTRGVDLTAVYLQQQMLDMMSLPKPQLMTFDGDPLKFHVFLTMFDSCVHRSNISDASKLNRLFELCKGKAMRVIEPCALNAVDGYTQARRLLISRFGNDFEISEKYIQKIVTGGTISASKASALQDFADDVRGCVETLRAMNRLDEVDTRSRLVRLVERLPTYLQNRWRKDAVSQRLDRGSYPGIDAFITFLDRAAIEASDPVFGIKEQKQTSSSFGNKFAQKSKAVSSFSAATSVAVEKAEKVHHQFTAAPERPLRKCPLCSGEHPIYTCEQFKGKSSADRLVVANEKGLCYNCLKIAKHTPVDCRVERVCGTFGCKMKHSYLLHQALTALGAKKDSAAGGPAAVGDRSSLPANIANCSASISGDNNKICLPIVAVNVKAAGSSKEVTTLALLDTGSTKTFCSESLRVELHASGRSTSFSVNTLHGVNEVQAVETELQIQSVTGASCVSSSPNVFSVQAQAVKDLPSLKSNVGIQQDVRKWRHLDDVPVANSNLSLGLIIGQDYSDLQKPLEVRSGEDSAPYAVRTLLGWTLNGPVSLPSAAKKKSMVSHHCYFASLEEQVENFWKVESVGTSKEEKMSMNDRKVLKLWDENVGVVDGHYEFEIPFKEESPDLPDNRYMAARRLQYLGKKLGKDDKLRVRYKQEIDALLDKGFAEKVTSGESSPGRTWYIPHHAVFNPNKPEKLRVVYDCSATYEGVSLNSAVHQGPDMTNKLVGVLLRFRQEKYALMSDVEAMYHQIVVPVQHRDALRFLWWKNGDPGQPAEVYRMTRHLFGGIWSASVANYALKRSATDHQEDYEQGVVNAVLSSFYVDDLLHAVESEERGILLALQIQDLLSKKGFNLNKWMSNSRRILETFPEEKRAKSVRDLDIRASPLPNERALGLEWVTESDVFRVAVKPKDPVFTRRGLLSYLSSVYDPLGIVCPFVLLAKKLFQEETRLLKEWDDNLEPENVIRFEKWLCLLPQLHQVTVPRWVFTDLSGEVNVELHHFADASSEAYGTASYIRAKDQEGNVRVRFIFGKSRLAPMKYVTIPRLELMAAVVAVNIDAMLRRELTTPVVASYFWTDSTAVLGYINNCNRKFQVFVANRLSQIHENSQPAQWRHVGTSENPADDASRGIVADRLKGRWLCGPEFLREEEKDWPEQPSGIGKLPEDAEVKQASPPECAAVFYAQDKDPSDACLSALFIRYSSWYKLRRAVARLQQFIQWLKAKRQIDDCRRLSVKDLQQAEEAIFRYDQRLHFGDEIKALMSNASVPSHSCILRLEPFIDDKRIMRVGGRLVHAPMPEQTKQQILLAAKSHVALLLVRDTHESETRHSGTEMVLAFVRQKFWITKARRVIKSVLSRCVTCKMLYARPKQQMMADLPPERVTPNSPPFRNVGVDCFGPFHVKRGRSTEKRYGCIFTCLAVRAVHVEMLASLDADSFINGVARFVSRRGLPELIRCDNGTNFVGGSNELSASMDEWNSKVTERLMQRKIQFKFNTPRASHHGGVWERQIRSIRRIMSAIVLNSTLDDERLATIFCEVESIINSRPLTRASDCPSDDPPLTPNHLLLAYQVQRLPPGVFTMKDIYTRRWRHVQHVVNHFWTRWTREYIANIQHRQKWLQPSINLKVDDIVLVVDELTHRNQWPLGRIVQVFTGPDGLVRSATVKTQSSVLKRPVTKLCFLEGATE